MKHAGKAALDALEGLLERLRSLSEIREKSRGVFYHRSKAFLHFHEDPTGLYADVRESDDFERYRVDSADDQHALLETVRRHLGRGR